MACRRTDDQISLSVSCAPGLSTSHYVNPQHRHRQPWAQSDVCTFDYRPTSVSICLRLV